MADTHTDHTSKLKRLNRVEGQVRGISKMIEEGKYCVDILTQIKAAKSALGSIERQILEDHMHGCIKKSFKEKSLKKSEQMIDEVISLVKKMTN